MKRCSIGAAPGISPSYTCLGTPLLLAFNPTLLHARAMPRAYFSVSKGGSVDRIGMRFASLQRAVREAGSANHPPPISKHCVSGSLDSILLPLRSEHSILDLPKALRRPLQLARGVVIQPLRMLVDIELILPLPSVSTLHHMLAQNLRHALCVLQRCCRGYRAAFCRGVAVEFGAGVGAGGVEGWCVICNELVQMMVESYNMRVGLPLNAMPVARRRWR